MGGRIFHQTHWAPLLDLQGSIAEVKLDLVNKAGTVVPMLLNAARRMHGAARFHAVSLVVAEDRHRYERELLVARKRAEQLLINEREARRALSVAQTRLGLARESALLFLWDADPASRTRRYDDEVALLLGSAQAEPVGEARFVERIHPDDRAREAAAFAAALDGTTGGYACIVRLVGVDGAQRTVSGYGRLLKDGDGGASGFVGVLHDVTELSMERAAAMDRAAFAEQMMGIVSHDLRNPLAVIHMSAGLLSRAPLDETQTRRVARIEASGRRAQRLIDDLLDFTAARLGRGLPVTRATFPLHDVVADGLDELAVAFPGRRIEHRRTGDGDAFIDRDRLAQLIGNLVANAMHYGAPDTVIVVGSHVEDDRFRIVVTNQGPPIPPTFMPRLFEPMTRGIDDADSRRSVGLGLYIVREIARAHGGDVRAASADGETTFTVELPRASTTRRPDF